jgi:hypothetical protein
VVGRVLGRAGEDETTETGPPDQREPR